MEHAMPSRATSTARQFHLPGDVPIHVTIHPGSGPALLLIHGISGAGDTWDPIIGPFCEHFTPITIDQRGHGESGKPEHGYLYDDYIGDLDRVLDYLELATPLIMGHSLGGLVTLWWAARHPERAAALVIEDSPLRSGEDFRPAFDNWIHLNSLPYDQLWDYYAIEHPNWKRETIDARARMMHATAPNVFAELKQDSMAHHGVDRIREIEHVASPTLLIHGDLETGGMVHPNDAQGFTTRLPNATTHRIPGGNHSLHLEHIRAFLAVAIPFLQTHAASASHLDTKAR